MSKFKRWLIRKLGGVPETHIGPRDRQLLLRCDTDDIVSLHQEIAVADGDVRKLELFERVQRQLVSEMSEIMYDQKLFSFRCRKDAYGAFFVECEIRIVVGDEKHA